MKYAHIVACFVGYSTIAMTIAGAVGLADFRMLFGPVGTITCTTDNSPIAARSGGGK